MKSTYVDLSNINNIKYVDLMALLDEINRPPGGKESLRLLVQNTFLTSNSNVLDVGCNTGYCTFEIAHLADCRVTGLDINTNMINSANKMLTKNHLALINKVKFIKGDGRNLPFGNNRFDLVMSGGSTAFISDIPKTIREYARVTKQWGFIGDINFFYHTKPPKKLIDSINSLMGTNILPWTMDYWLEQYKRAKLEMYYYAHGKMTPVTKAKITDYAKYLVSKKKWPKKISEIAIKRIEKIMTLFNDNHKYLAYGIFIMRKLPIYDEILF